MNAIERLKNITPKEFALLGMNDVAYVKRTVVNDEAVITIHSADGTQIGVAPDRETAFAAIRQHELEPVSLH